MKSTLTATLPLQFDFAKRWRQREQRWRTPEIVFDPSQHRVDLLPERDARAFVLEHHYMGTFPAARLCAGLYRGLTLVGAAVFSVPMNQATITKYSGLEPSNGCELGRFVLLDEVPFNGESFFLARALRILRAVKPAMRVVVSFADPLPRHDARSLQETKPAHTGIIYRASNATFFGRATPRTETILPDGSILVSRTLSKISGEERGIDHCLRKLTEAGLPKRSIGESGRNYLERIDPLLRHRRHPGNFAFAFGLDRKARRLVDGAAALRQQTG